MKKNYTVLIVIALIVFVAFASAQVLHLAFEIEPGTFPAGDFGFQGNVEVSKNGEVFVNVKNSDANGKDYALISAGALGGIGAGKFSIYDKGLGVSRMVVDQDGNIGIGTTSPAQKLDVAGSVRVSGTVCDANGCITGRDCRPGDGFNGDACDVGFECNTFSGACIPAIIELPQISFEYVWGANGAYGGTDTEPLAPGWRWSEGPCYAGSSVAANYCYLYCQGGSRWTFTCRQRYSNGTMFTVDDSFCGGAHPSPWTCNP
jgi:hypothetical protein